MRRYRDRYYQKIRQPIQPVEVTLRIHPNVARQFEYLTGYTRLAEPPGSQRVPYLCGEFVGTAVYIDPSVRPDAIYIRARADVPAL